MNTKQNFWDYFNIINIWFDTVMLATWWTSKHSHMDHWIGCPTYVFTVAYAVLWLEVLLHIKVFHIRRTTTGGRGRPPYPLLKIIKKCPGFGKKDPDSLHPEVKYTIQNIVYEYLGQKAPTFSAAGPFILDFLRKCLSKYPNF